MKRNFRTILLILLFAKYQGFAQGNFQNLDFESANVSGYPPGSAIPAANAFPDWTVNAGAILYDSISLEGGCISLIDTNGLASYTPIQGKYFAMLVGDISLYPPSITVSIGQTGQIPSSAESITFWGYDQGLQITFAGEPLSFMAISNTANYTVYDANISAFAGQTGQLLFTALPGTDTTAGYGEIDNIQFSSMSIPEPGVPGLFTLGGLCFVWRRWRK